MLRPFLAALTVATTVLTVSVAPTAAQIITAGDNVRLKDIAVIQGARSNQVSGMGLVVGLPGTGATQQNNNTTRALENVIQRLNNIPITEIQGQ
ncbi:MAG: flagellar basal body P-ring protein FlgI, partial [Acidimicrobiia bacterium]